MSLTSSVTLGISWTIQHHIYITQRLHTVATHCLWEREATFHREKMKFVTAFSRSISHCHQFIADTLATHSNYGNLATMRPAHREIYESPQISSSTHSIGLRISGKLKLFSAQLSTIDKGQSSIVCLPTQITVHPQCIQRRITGPSIKPSQQLNTP